MKVQFQNYLFHIKYTNQKSMDGGVYNLVFGKLTRIKFWIKISRRYVYEFIESICFHNT